MDDVTDKLIALSAQRKSEADRRDLGIKQALARLVEHAKGNSGQARKVADFLLSWWNAEELGAWSPTDLWQLDDAICDDIMTVLAYINKRRAYPDSIGLGAEFQGLVRQWRQGK